MVVAHLRRTSTAYITGLSLIAAITEWTYIPANVLDVHLLRNTDFADSETDNGFRFLPNHFIFTVMILCRLLISNCNAQENKNRKLN